MTNPADPLIKFGARTYYGQMQVGWDNQLASTVLHEYAHAIGHVGGSHDGYEVPFVFAGGAHEGKTFLKAKDVEALLTKQMTDTP